MGSAALPPRESFRRAVSVPPSQVDLLAASLYIAAGQYPDLDIVATRGRVALLAARVRALLGRRHSLFDAVHAVNEVLFREEGIRGDRDDYYDPRNSYLPDVLDRKLGIPITLSLLHIEIGQRVGYRFVGIGIPGHFLVRAGEGAGAIYVDPFNDGGLLSRKECLELVQQATRGPEAAGPALSPEDAALLMRPTGKRAVIRRLLTNLKRAYMERVDLLPALRVAEWIRIVEPTLWHNLADLARFQAELGRYGAAVETLSTYLKGAPRGHDLSAARAALRELRTLEATSDGAAARLARDAGDHEG
ncbi:MAG: transglutaminase-like domain-containing protein [Dehalococcoidia bacterium]